MDLGFSYYGTHFSKHINADMKEMVGMGCSFIVVCPGEFQLDFYFPATKKIIQSAKRHGLKVYINFWGHGNTFGGEAPSIFTGEFPEASQITNKGRRLDRACFSQSKFKKFMKKQVEKAVKQLDVDGVFWDEPRFFRHARKKEWACHCDKCNESYQKKFGQKIPEKYTRKVEKFRGEIVREFIKDLSEYAKRLAKRRGKELFISVCPMPYDKYWDELASIKAINAFGTDPYWIHLNKKTKKPIIKHQHFYKFVEERTRAAIRTAKKYNKKSFMWFQAFSILEGYEKQFKKTIQIMADQDPDFMAGWTFRCAENSVLASANSLRCWKIVKEEYQKIVLKQSVKKIKKFISRINTGSIQESKLFVLASKEIQKRKKYFKRD